MSLEIHTNILTEVKSDRLAMVTTVPQTTDLLLSQEQWETGRCCHLSTSSYLWDLIEAILTASRNSQNFPDDGCSHIFTVDYF